MKIGFIGLGRMGYNMTLQLLENNIQVVAFDVNKKAVKNISRHGAIGVTDLNDMLHKLPKQKIIWLMIPAGKPVDIVLQKILPQLQKGDIIIDGGNSFYKDTLQRHKQTKKKGIHYIDCGVSGGVSGARHGACMMIGSSKNIFKKVERLFKIMCVKNGYARVGEAGAGHFVKMVHNGIEYGMLGAIGEGMQAVKKHKKHFKINEKEVTKVYTHGSIIAGRLMSWLWEAVNEKTFFNSVSCKVPKGETEDEMKHLEKMAHMPVLHQARTLRIKSRKGKFCAKEIAAIRNKFGGHKVNKK
jgi:6-phosphogluconate dehydrogenase